jgi:hypothetical protein
MHRIVHAALIAAGLAVALPANLHSQAKKPATSSTSASRIKVCSLLPKAEVKRHLPWIAELDQFPPKDDVVGDFGSSCKYPSVMIQVMPFLQGTVDALRKQGAVETVAGIGDAAYFRNNGDNYAELFVRVGQQMLTLQASAHGDVGAVKPGTLSLAKALAAKLR